MCLLNFCFIISFMLNIFYTLYNIQFPVLDSTNRNRKSIKILLLSTRGALSRWDVKHVQDGRLCPPGRKLHLPLGGQTGICPHRWRCQLPDLGLPLSYGCPQGNLLRTYRGFAHLQERCEDTWLHAI